MGQHLPSGTGSASPEGPDAGTPPGAGDNAPGAGGGRRPQQPPPAPSTRRPQQPPPASAQHVPALVSVDSEEWLMDELEFLDDLYAPLISGPLPQWRRRVRSRSTADGSAPPQPRTQAPYILAPAAGQVAPDGGATPGPQQLQGELAQVQRLLLALLRAERAGPAGCAGLRTGLQEAANLVQQIIATLRAPPPQA